jgi:hypothetical protein
MFWTWVCGGMLRRWVCWEVIVICWLIGWGYLFTLSVNFLWHLSCWYLQYPLGFRDLLPWVTWTVQQWYWNDRRIVFIGRDKFDRVGFWHWDRTGLINVWSSSRLYNRVKPRSEFWQVSYQSCTRWRDQKPSKVLRAISHSDGEWATIGTGQSSHSRRGSIWQNRGTTGAR